MFTMNLRLDLGNPFKIIQIGGLIKNLPWPSSNSQIELHATFV